MQSQNPAVANLPLLSRLTSGHSRSVAAAAASGEDQVVVAVPQSQQEAVRHTIAKCAVTATHFCCASSLPEALYCIHKCNKIYIDCNNILLARRRSSWQLRH